MPSSSSVVIIRFKETAPSEAFPLALEDKLMLLIEPELANNRLTRSTSSSASVNPLTITSSSDPKEISRLSVHGSSSSQKHPRLRLLLCRFFLKKKHT